jgi:hypothetical protein
MSQQTVQATIANGAALSGQVNIGNRLLVGLWMPATWTAASITFQVSPDGGTTWLELYSSAGVETTFTVAASQFIAVDPETLRGINAVKVRSGTSGSPVNQNQQSIVTLVTI